MNNEPLIPVNDEPNGPHDYDSNQEDTAEMVGELFQNFESIPSGHLLQQIQSLISLMVQKDNLSSRKQNLLKNENHLQTEEIKLNGEMETLETNETMPIEEKKKQLDLLKKKLREVSNKLNAIPKASQELDKSEAQLLIQMNALKQQLCREYPDQENLIEKMIQQIAEPEQLNTAALRSQMQAQNLPPDLNDKQLVLYSQLLPIAELLFSFEKVGRPEEHAFKLALLNNSLEQAMKFLADSAKYNTNSESVLHTACLFTLPRLDQINLKVWLQIGQKMRGDFTYYKEQFLNQYWPQAEEIQKWLDEHRKPKNQRLSPAELKAQINELNKIQREYKELERHHGTLNDQDKKRHDALQTTIYRKQCEITKLGVEFSKDIQIDILEAVRKRQFTEAKPEFKTFLKNGLNQSNFNRFLELDRSEAGKNIPELSIDGASVDESLAGYYLMKVNVQDDAQAARAACYGKLTHCCQSISGEAGEPCTIHGLTSPNGGFYIICKGDPENPKPDDELVAQSWAWLGKSGSIVLDSIELADYQESDKVIKFYRKFAYELVKNNLAPRVLTGATSGLTPYVGFGLTKEYQNEYFLDYRGYCDSLTKNTLCEPEYLYYYYNQLDGVNESIEQYIEEQVIQSLKPNQRYDSLIEMINYDYTSALREERKKENLDRLNSNNTGQQHALLACIIKIAEKHGASHLISEIQEDLNQMRSADFDSEEAYTALIEKVKTGKLSPNTLLGTYPNATSPIIIATKHNKIEDVTLLLSLGASTRFIDEDLNTPLILAVKNRNKELARYLMDRGSAVSHENSEHVSALLYAFNTGQLDIADELIERGADVDGTWDTDGVTPIMHVVKLGDEARVMNLLNKGVKVDDQDGECQTPLMHAIKVNNLAIVKMIAARTSKKYFQKMDTDGHNALMLAASQDSVEIFNYLINNHSKVKELASDSREILFKACQMQTIDEAFNYIISTGKPELIRNSQELLALSDEQFKKCVKHSFSLEPKNVILFLESMDKSVIDKINVFNGKNFILGIYNILTDLSIDRYRADELAELMSFMQRKGYKISDNIEEQYEVLNNIISSKNSVLLNQFLNDTHLDLNLQLPDASFTLPIFAALKSDKWRDIFDVLIQHKADLNKSFKHSTVLSIALNNKAIDQVGYFLKNGVTIQQKDVDAMVLRDWNGRTAFHYAVNDPDALKAMINSMGDKRELMDVLMVKDREGKSVYHYALNNPESFQIVLDCIPDEEMLSDVLMTKDDKGGSLAQLCLSKYDSLKIIMDKFPDDQWLRFFIPPDTNTANVAALIRQLFSECDFDLRVQTPVCLIIKKLFEMNLLNPTDDSGLNYAIQNPGGYTLGMVSRSIINDGYNPYAILNLIVRYLDDFRLEDLGVFMNMMKQAEKNNWEEVHQKLHAIFDNKLGLSGFEWSETELQSKLPIKKAIEQFNPEAGKVQVFERQLAFTYHFASDSFEIQSTASSYMDEMDETFWVCHTLKEDEEEIVKNLSLIGLNTESIQKITAQFSEGQNGITIKLDEEMKQQILSANYPELNVPRKSLESAIKPQIPTFFKPAHQAVNKGNDEDNEKVEQPEM